MAALSERPVLDIRELTVRVYWGDYELWTVDWDREITDPRRAAVQRALISLERRGLVKRCGRYRPSTPRSESSPHDKSRRRTLWRLSRRRLRVTIHELREELL